MFDPIKYRKEHKEYFKENNKKNREIDKELGVRYRGWEAMPGESFTEFKRRLKSVRKPQL